MLRKWCIGGMKWYMLLFLEVKLSWVRWCMIFFFSFFWVCILVWRNRLWYFFSSGGSFLWLMLLLFSMDSGLWFWFVRCLMRMKVNSVRCWVVLFIWVLICFGMK